MAIEIINWADNQTKQEWLSLRRNLQGLGETYTRIGASDIGTITGSSGNSKTSKSKRRLFLELAGLYRKELLNNLVVQGSVMEDKVQERWEGYVVGDEEESLRNVRDGIRERKIKQARFFLLNPSLAEHIFISLDAIPDETWSHEPFEGELLQDFTPHEMKYLNPESYKSWSAPISQSYLEQLTLQTHMTESQYGIFLPLLWDYNFHPIKVDYDKDLAEYLVDLSGKFCGDVTKAKVLKLRIDSSTDESEVKELTNELEELIPLDTHADTYELLCELKVDYNKDLRKLESDSEADKLMADYVEAKQQEKNLEAKVNGIKSKLVLLSEEFEGILTPNHKLICRGFNSTKSRYFSVKALTNK